MTPSPGSEPGDQAMTDTPSHPPAATALDALKSPKLLASSRTRRVKSGDGSYGQPISIHLSLRCSGSVQQILSAMLPHGG